MAASVTPGVALMLSCCGIPAQWAGRAALFAEHVDKLRAVWESLGKPRIMAACSSCLAALRQALPEAVPLSLWEVLDGMGLPEGPPAASAPLPEVFSIHDPCTARHDGAWLAAVRRLATRAGARDVYKRQSSSCRARRSLRGR